LWQFAAERPAADEISIDSAMQHVPELSSNGVAAANAGSVTPTADGGGRTQTC